MENEISSGAFYRIAPDSKVIIEKAKLLQFWESRGYRKLPSENNDYELVRISKTSIVEYAKEHMLADEVRNYLEAQESNHELVFEEYLNKDYATKSLIKNLKSIQIDFSYGSPDESIFFYLNGVVKITARGHEIIPYENYEGYLWKEQINPRDFSPIKGYEDAVFGKFLYNIAGSDMSRLRSLRTIIGYLMHSYKDPTLSPAIILLDEDLDLSNNEAKGGKGKSLLAKGIGKIIPYYYKDGKTLKTNSQFLFSGVERYHKLISFDDVNADFDFELLFSMITGDFSLEKKYKNEKIISFKESPKVLISSNYMLSGVRGFSSDRRKIEFEISNHYGRHLSPMDEFGHRFFDDWDIEEWQRFDCLMLICTSEYLNTGLLAPQPINLIENRLRIETHPRFLDFISAEIQKSGRYNKKQLFDKFREQYKKDVFGVTPNQFGKWLTLWAEYNGYNYNHKKSNGQQYFIVEINTANNAK